jgi:hypothetical protein
VHDLELLEQLKVHRHYLLNGRENFEWVLAPSDPSRQSLSLAVQLKHFLTRSYLQLPR